MHHAYIWGLIGFANILLVTVIVWGWSLAGINDKVSNILINISTSYLAPNVIFASLSLLLCFSYIKLTSKTINKIAISAFAAVLVHGFHMDELYKPLVRNLYYSNGIIIFLLKITAVITLYMTFSVILDKGRLYLWNKLYSQISNYISKKLICK